MKKISPTFVPVIHTLNTNQVTENVAIALNNGADGVFLVNHGHNTTKEIFQIFYPAAKKVAGDKFVGINDLTLIHHPEHAMKNAAVHNVDGLRVDNPMILHDKLGLSIADHVQQVREVFGWEGVYFGGVNFKHQLQLNEGQLIKLKPRVDKLLDVIVTSGPRTGVAANPTTIQQFHQVFFDNLTAIASGITPENITDYLEFIDIFMVATGISHDFHHLNPRKVEQITKLLH